MFGVTFSYRRPPLDRHFKVASVVRLTGIGDVDLRVLNLMRLGYFEQFVRFPRTTRRGQAERTAQKPGEMARKQCVHLAPARDRGVPIATMVGHPSVFDGEPVDMREAFAGKPVQRLRLRRTSRGREAVDRLLVGFDRIWTGRSNGCPSFDRGVPILARLGGTGCFPIGYFRRRHG